MKKTAEKLTANEVSKNIKVKGVPINRKDEMTDIQSVMCCGAECNTKYGRGYPYPYYMWIIGNETVITDQCAYIGEGEKDVAALAAIIAEAIGVQNPLFHERHFEAQAKSLIGLEKQ